MLYELNTSLIATYQRCRCAALGFHTCVLLTVARPLPSPVLRLARLLPLLTAARLFSSSCSAGGCCGEGGLGWCREERRCSRGRWWMRKGGKGEQQGLLVGAQGRGDAAGLLLVGVGAQRRGGRGSSAFIARAILGKGCRPFLARG